MPLILTACHHDHEDCGFLITSSRKGLKKLLFRGKLQVGGGQIASLGEQQAYWVSLVRLLRGESAISVVPALGLSEAPKQLSSALFDNIMGLAVVSGKPGVAFGQWQEFFSLVNDSAFWEALPDNVDVQAVGPGECIFLPLIMLLSSAPSAPQCVPTSSISSYHPIDEALLRNVVACVNGTTVIGSPVKMDQGSVSSSSSSEEDEEASITPPANHPQTPSTASTVGHYWSASSSKASTASASTVDQLRCATGQLFSPPEGPPVVKTVGTTNFRFASFRLHQANVKPVFVASPLTPATDVDAGMDTDGMSSAQQTAVPFQEDDSMDTSSDFTPKLKRKQSKEFGNEFEDQRLREVLREADDHLAVFEKAFGYLRLYGWTYKHHGLLTRYFKTNGKDVFDGEEALLRHVCANLRIPFKFGSLQSGRQRVDRSKFTKPPMTKATRSGDTNINSLNRLAKAKREAELAQFQTPKRKKRSQSSRNRSHSSSSTPELSSTSSAASPFEMIESDMEEQPRRSRGTKRKVDAADDEQAGVIDMSKHSVTTDSLPAYTGDLAQYIKLLTDNVNRNNTLPFPVPGRVHESIYLFNQIMHSLRTGQGKLIYVSGLPGNGKSQTIEKTLEVIGNLFNQQCDGGDYQSDSSANSSSQRKRGRASDSEGSLPSRAPVKGNAFHLIKCNANRGGLKSILEDINKVLAIVPEAAHGQWSGAPAVSEHVRNKKAIPCTLPYTSLEVEYQHYVPVSMVTNMELAQLAIAKHSSAATVPNYRGYNTSTLPSDKPSPMIIVCVDEIDSLKEQHELFKLTNGRLIVVGSGNDADAFLPSIGGSSDSESTGHGSRWNDKRCVVFAPYEADSMVDIIARRTGDVFDPMARRLLALKVKERKDGDVRTLQRHMEAVMGVALKAHQASGAPDPHAPAGFVKIAHVNAHAAELAEKEKSVEERRLDSVTDPCRWILVSMLVAAKPDTGTAASVGSIFSNYVHYMDTRHPHVARHKYQSEVEYDLEHMRGIFVLAKWTERVGHMNIKMYRVQDPFPRLLAKHETVWQRDVERYCEAFQVPK